MLVGNVYIGLCVFVLNAFLFCKQKTAYEMRISDCSSGVCSSDLHRRMSCRGGAPPANHQHQRERGKAGAQMNDQRPCKIHDAHGGEPPAAPDPEMGRASRRESVCEHV